MEGHETFRMAVSRLVEVTREAVEAAELGLGDIDLFVYHQANGRIMRAVAERLEPARRARGGLHRGLRQHLRRLDPAGPRPRGRRGPARAPATACCSRPWAPASPGARPRSSGERHERRTARHSSPGASRGIGAAVARALAADGWRVGLNYRSDEEGAARVAREIEAAGGSALPLPGDVSDPATADRLLDRARGALRPVLVLVNNAGVRDDAARAPDRRRGLVARARHQPHAARSGSPAGRCAR